MPDAIASCVNDFVNDTICLLLHLSADKKGVLGDVLLVRLACDE